MAENHDNNRIGVETLRAQIGTLENASNVQDSYELRISGVLQRLPPNLMSVPTQQTQNQANTTQATRQTTAFVMKINSPQTRDSALAKSLILKELKAQKIFNTRDDAKIFISVL